MSAPLEDPLSYPGQRPGAPFLLRGDRIEPWLEPLVAPLPPDVDVSKRRAVLAIGSNACPPQLALKFRDRGCSDVVLGLIVDVDALTVCPSAHVSRSGYWPFAPARLDGGVARCVLTLLDDDQVEVLDLTEPNYERVVLDPVVHRVRLTHVTSGAAVRADVEVYRSRHGVVDDDRLPAFSRVSRTDPPPSQHALLDALVGIAPDGLPGGDAETLSDAVRQAPDRADDVTAAIRQHLRVRSAALATLTARGQDERRSGRPATRSASER